MFVGVYVACIAMDSFLTLICARSPLDLPENSLFSFSSSLVGLFILRYFFCFPYHPWRYYLRTPIRMTSFRDVWTLDFFSYSNSNNFLPLHLIFVIVGFPQCCYLCSCCWVLHLMTCFTLLLLCSLLVMLFSLFNLVILHISSLCQQFVALWQFCFIHFFNYKFFSAYYVVLFCGFVVSHFKAAWLFTAADETAVFFYIISGW